MKNLVLWLTAAVLVLAAPVIRGQSKPADTGVTIELVAPKDGDQLASPAWVTLTADAQSTVGLIGRVEFYENEKLVATRTKQPYETTLLRYTTGGFTYVAKAFLDDATTEEPAATSKEVRITIGAVNQPPSVALREPSAGAVFSKPSKVSMSVTATDSDGHIVRVEYYASAAKIGESTTGPGFTAQWNDAAWGSHSIVARAYDNAGLATDSSPVSISIRSAGVAAPNSLEALEVAADLAATGGATLQDPVAVDDQQSRARVSRIPGEQIDLRTGALTLRATDLTVPGNGGLDIVVSRVRRSSFFRNPLWGGALSTGPTLTDGGDYLVEKSIQGLIGDWQLDLPHVRLILTDNFFELVDSSAEGLCNKPYTPDPWTGVVNLAYFRGIQLVGVPGQDMSEMLFARSPLQTNSQGFWYRSAERWEMFCANSRYAAVNRPTVFPRGKFVAKSPDGMVYEFDEPARGAPLMTAGRLLPPSAASIAQFSHQFAFVSKATDRNGNWLEFEYYDRAPGLYRPAQDFPYLKSVTASDGRRVDFRWECNEVVARPQSVTGSPSSPNGLPDCIGGNVTAAQFSSCTQSSSGGVVFAVGSAGNRRLCGGAPRWRLKDVQYGTRIVRYEYSDDREDADRGRYLLRVRTLDASTNPPASAGRDWQYALSRDTDPSSTRVTYTVTHPGGGRVEYDLATRLFLRRVAGGTAIFNTYWFGTALLAKRVTRDPASSDVDRWQYCYDSLATSDNTPAPVRTFEIGPDYMRRIAFQRERPAPNDAGLRYLEGAPVSEAIIARPASVTPSCDQLVGGTYAPLRDVTYAWERGSALSVVTTSTVNPDSFLYQDATRFRKRNTKVTTAQSDTGRFETEFSDFAGLDLPRTTTEKRLSASGAVLESRAATVTYQPFIGVNDGTATSGPMIVGLVQSRTIAGIAGSETRTYNPANGNLERINRYGVSRSFTHHPSGDAATETDERGATTRFDDYRAGVPRRVTLPPAAGKPGGDLELREVDARGLITSFTNARGKRFVYGYDALGRLASTDYPIGADVTVSWLNPRSKVTTRGDRRTTQRFDGFGRLVAEETTDTKRNETVVRTSAYDFAGRTTFESYRHSPGAQIDGLTTAYDPLGRVASVSTTADGATTSYAYSISGSLEQKVVTDPRGVATSYRYRSFGTPDYEQLMEVQTIVTGRVDNKGSPLPDEVVRTEFSRDVLGFSTEVRQGGQVRRFTLDARRMLAGEYQPELGHLSSGNNVTYVRNDHGDVESKSINGVIQFQVGYDARNRPMSTSYADGAPPISIDYTANDKPRLITKGAGAGAVVHELDYDDMDRVRWEEYRLDGLRFRIGYDYDEVGSLNAITYPSGKVYALSPDAMARPRAVAGIASSVSYHASGRLQAVGFNNGATHSMSLTPRTFPDTITVSRPGTSIVNLDYDYDNAGNVTQLADLLYPSDSLGSISYDALNRLTSYQQGGQTYRRGYDATGNVLFDQNGDRRVVLTYDPLTSRLSSVSGSTTGGASISRSVQYDTRGNIRADGTRVLAFDAAGNLGSAQGTTAKSFLHDGRDRIIKEVAALPGGSTSTRYLLYSGEKLLMEYWPVQQTYTEYVYLGELIVGSRVVQAADRFDSDGDGVFDTAEFR